MPFSSFQIPNVSPTGRFVTIVPFTIILVLTAIKELIEDIKRHRADDKVNSSLVQVLDYNGGHERKKWKDVVVGDVVRVENETFFPADLVRGSRCFAFVALFVDLSRPFSRVHHRSYYLLAVLKRPSHVKSIDVIDVVALPTLFVPPQSSPTKKTYRRKLLEFSGRIIDKLREVMPLRQDLLQPFMAVYSGEIETFRFSLDLKEQVFSDLEKGYVF